jgi:hypothetical protein
MLRPSLPTWPAICHRPSLRSSRPHSTLTMLVLPLPLGPISRTMSPRRTVKAASSTSVTPDGVVIVRPLTDSTGSGNVVIRASPAAGARQRPGRRARCGRAGPA